MPYTFAVGSYSGVISTVLFTPSDKSLKLLYATKESAPAPSWQHFDIVWNLNYLYSVNEGGEGIDGSIDVYQLQEDGTLKKTDSAPATNGTVSVDRAKQGFMASASYGGAAIDTYRSNPNAGGLIEHLTTLHFTLPPDHASKPGVNPTRQDTSHPHQAIFDPLKQFLLVPDLGADLVRVFLIDYDSVVNSAATLEEIEPIVVVPGSGPRHLAFNNKGDRMYLINELSCMLEVYAVSYDYDTTNGKKKMVFEKRQSISMLGHGDRPTDSNVDATLGAEIVVSHDDKHIYASNRFDGLSPSGNDTIAHFSIPTPPLPRAKAKVHATHTELKFEGLYSCGGKNPRHFTLTPDGNYLATVTQDSNKMCIFGRDAVSGKIDEEPIVTLDVEKGVCVTCVKIEGDVVGGDE